MKIEEFEQRLRDSVLIADGAMGSLLYETLGPQRCVDELNATRAEEVFRIHMAYLEAGAHIIETNTFGANRNKLAAFGLEERVAEFNHRGVKIAREAREAAKHEVLIAGSIGPLGVIRQVREFAADHAREIFREQAEALEERGVDFFVLETFGDLRRAVRGDRSHPLVFAAPRSSPNSPTPKKEPRSAGRGRATPGRSCASSGIQAIGANCSVGPQDHLRILQELGEVAGSFPMSAMPNVGFPQRVGDRVVYPKSSPEYFDLFAREAVVAGRAHSGRMLRNHAGTYSRHGSRGAKASTRRDGARAAAAVEAAPEAHPVAAREPESALWRKIQAQAIRDLRGNRSAEGHFDRTRPRAGAATSWLRNAWTPSTSTAARWRAWAWTRSRFRGALEARGIETIPHLTTRDANLIGLQAMLLGAWTVGGVRNVLAVTGDPPSLGSYPESFGVYEVDSIGLVKVMARLNQGTDWAGKNLGGATNFTIGVAVNPLAEDLDEELRRFHAKVEAGAHFAMTQPIFDPDHWEQFLKRMGGKSPIPDHGRPVAAEQLQAGLAPAQRSARHRDSR